MARRLSRHSRFLCPFIDVKFCRPSCKPSFSSVKKMAEDAKVAIRNIRRDGVDDVKKLEKTENLSEDDVKNNQNEVQKITDKFTKIIDSLTQEKEQEVLKV